MNNEMHRLREITVVNNVGMRVAQEGYSVAFQFISVFVQTGDNE